MPALRTAAPLMADPWAASSGIDMNTVAGVAAGLLGVGGGVALIAFTENAGKANEQRANAQPCVECKGEKVVTCTICDGSGVDPLATLVQGVREATGEAKPANVVTVEVCSRTHTMQLLIRSVNLSPGEHCSLALPGAACRLANSVHGRRTGIRGPSRSSCTRRS